MQQKQHHPSGLLSLVAGVLILLCVCIGIPAAAFAEETVYIAGNPSMAPFEFYDPDKQVYRGILPDLYHQLEAETGIHFTYISPGIINQQWRLIQNRQVELVSAHVPKEDSSLSDEIPVYTYSRNQRQYTVSIGFTDSMPPETAAQIRNALDQLSDSDLLALTLENYTDDSKDQSARSIAFFIGILLCAFAALGIGFWLYRHIDREQEHLRLTDPLTQLGNPAFLKESIENHLSADIHFFCYIVCFSVDNERICGTELNDMLQRTAASVLSRSIESREFAIRVSDGVFAVSLCSVTEGATQSRAQEILVQLNQAAQPFCTRFYAGICPLTLADMDSNTGLQIAQRACLYARKNDLDFQVADSAFQRKDRNRLLLDASLVDALQNDEFVVHLQLIVDTKTGKFCGAEALSRWQNPRAGLLKPIEYIDALSSFGMLHELDFSILEKTCNLLEQWSKTELADLWLSCNFSRQTLARSDFQKRFFEIVDRFHFNYKNLVLELTEDELHKDDQASVQNVRACHEAGFRIALDDLGSGYASLCDFCTYQLDIIKLDRKFFLKTVSQEGYTLIKGLVDLAHHMGYQVLCEGINTDEKQHLAVYSDFDYVQSFSLSKALPVDIALDYLQSFNAQEKAVPTP